MNDISNDVQINTSQEQIRIETRKPFAFIITKPFSNADKPKPQFLIDGLIQEGGIASLVAKPKHSKSSLSRYAAVCITKGEPFLGRPVSRGEVLLITVEDPIGHVENCLNVLGWNRDTDEQIHIIERVSPKTDDNMNALRNVLSQHPQIKLVVIDTFAKFGRVKDMNEYGQWLTVFDGLKQLRVDFPHVSFLGLLHAKKTKGDDLFDSMLGSSALRGEFDSNIGVYDESGKRIITAECRMGKAIPETILEAAVEESEGCDVVKAFSLGRGFDDWSREQKGNAEVRRNESMDERIITYLSTQPGERAFYKQILEDVHGREQTKIQAVSRLIEKGILIESGTKGSPMEPYMLTLNREELSMHDFIHKFNGGGTVK